MRAMELLRAASRVAVGVGLGASVVAGPVAAVTAQDGALGREVAIPRHLRDGEEYTIPRRDLIDYGGKLFDAKWTAQEGGGRPLSTGTGAGLHDPSDPLVFPRNFNRLSAPDSNACSGCHAQPVRGGAGDIVANVFVLAQRFDFATFSAGDGIPGKGAVDENGTPVTLDTIANSRATTGMFGSGYLEMLARQMTGDLQAARDALAPGSSVALASKGVSFGVLARAVDGSWDVSAVEGLGAPSLQTTGGAPPSLIVLPWHQASAVVSLRQFANNAFNHHHGIQTEERFGEGVDADGDGFVDEMTRADVTAVSLWQATLPVPGRVIPSEPYVEDAILHGEHLFAAIGCATCHVPALPLNDWGWFYTEPNPYNPPGNLRVGDAPTLEVNLNSRTLPGPRLHEDRGVTWVPAYTDMRLHDITSGPDDPNRETLNMHFAPGSDEFLAGNSRFLTKRLWGAGNTAPYFHHGKFTTLRQAVLAHAGEAQAQADAFRALSDDDKNALIEFLKSLQVLPEGTTAQVIDDRGRPRQWPPADRR